MKEILEVRIPCDRICGLVLGDQSGLLELREVYVVAFQDDVVGIDCILVRECHTARQEPQGMWVRRRKKTPMDVERILFLAEAFATHAIVGYALVRGFTDVDPRIGAIFGVVPDVDFCFPAEWNWPLVHRGVTHTPLFALAVVAGTYAVRRDRTVERPVGLAIGSHLVIDSLSPKGINWLFPLKVTASPDLPVHGPVATILFWSVSIGFLLFQGNDLYSIR